MKKIIPFLWFDHHAEEAINYYGTIFDNVKVNSINKYPGGPMEGKAMMASFEIEGQTFYAMDAGPQFKFNEAVSFFVNCKDQAEVDRYWDKLVADGGEESMCGWVKDKYGLWWQIIPQQLGQFIGNPDPEKSNRAVQAMLKMKKIIVADLEKAAENK